MGIVQEIESPFPEITVSSIIDRVIANRKRLNHSVISLMVAEDLNVSAFLLT